MILTSVTPVLTAGGRLVVDGTVRNTGPEPLDTVQAYLRYLRSPVTTRAGLTEALDERVTVPGATLLTTRYAELADRLAPGATAPLHLDVAVDELGVGDAGAYPVDVEIRATLPDRTRAAVATERTVVPLVPAGRRVPMTVLVPLADRPHRVSRTVFADDDLAAAVAPTGRLGRVLAAVAPGTRPLARPQLVLDPMLVEEVAAMAGGYRVLDAGSTERTGTSAALPATPTTGDPGPAGTAPVAPTPRPLADEDLPAVTTRAGSGAAAATGWLTRLRAAAAGTTVLLLPWGNPDPGSTPPAALRDAAQRAVAVARAAGLGARLLAWPSTADDGTVDRRAVTAAAVIGTDLVLLSSATTAPALADPATTPLRPLADEPAGTAGPPTALRADATLDRVLSTAGSGLQRRQRLLAETAVLAVAVQVPPPVLVALPPGWDPARLPTPVLSPAPAGADWPVPAPPLAAQAPGGPVTIRATGTGSGQVAGPDGTGSGQVGDPDGTGSGSAGGPADPAGSAPARDPATALAVADPRQLRQAAGLRRRTAELATVLTEPTGVTGGFAVSAAQLLSRQWAGTGNGYDAFRSAVTGALESLTAAVSVPATRAVTLSSGQGRFPITVTNRLRQRVRVRLLLQPDNALRLDIRQPNPRTVDVAPADSTTVSVRAGARTNGRTRVAATVTTPGGVPLGPSRPFQVTAQDYDTVGWVVIGVALALLFGASAVRIVRRLRARSAARA